MVSVRRELVVYSVLERTTRFADDGGALVFSGSSTPGVEVLKVYANGVRLKEVPEELFERVMDALHDEGWAT